MTHKRPPRDTGVRAIKLREVDRFSAECNECDAKWECDDYREFDEVRAEAVQHVRDTGHRITTRNQKHSLIKPKARTP